MQITSRDGRIVIMLTEDPINSAIYPQADFSIVESPFEEARCKTMYEQLYKSQRNNHIVLSTVRLPKKMRLKAFANMTIAEEAGFRYHDHITLVSQEEYKSIPSNLTQIGETCVLLTKSEDMNKKATEWFHTELGDCSNVWDVSPQEGETLVSKSISRHFCWEIGILLSQLSSPLIARRFLIVGIAEPSMAEFAYQSNMQMYCITTDEVTARRVIKTYHKFLDKQDSRGKNG